MSTVSRESEDPKLLELLEKDPVPGVRLSAMLALARMKVQAAQPVLIRILQQTDLDEKIRKQTVGALVDITEIPFRNTESALMWWEKEGKAAYNLIELNDTHTQEEADAATKPAVVRAPVNPTQDPAADSVNAEIIALDPLPEKKAAENTPPLPEKTAEVPPATNDAREPRTNQFETPAPTGPRPQRRPGHFD